MPEEKIAEFSDDGAPLKIEIRIGHARVGTCTYSLRNSNNHRLQHGSGERSRNTFPIESAPSTLDRALLRWSAIINANDDSPGQGWSLTLTIRQGDEPIYSETKEGTFRSLTARPRDEVRLIANEN